MNEKPPEPNRHASAFSTFSPSRLHVSTSTPPKRNRKKQKSGVYHKERTHDSDL